MSPDVSRGRPTACWPAASSPGCVGRKDEHGCGRSWGRADVERLGGRRRVGAVFVVVEPMKMEIPVEAGQPGAAGRIEVTRGGTVAEGAAIAVVRPAGDERVARLSPLFAAASRPSPASALIRWE
ncbi:biotin/lipoyl-containing protein [Streptomyces sp. NPDC001982]|uniref:biotin/lipoyl-containing protein n=1 Tax=Streptomyces sp. NPDC001982 TaxID=3154405 RepID=UPI00332B5E83